MTDDDNNDDNYQSDADGDDRKGYGSVDDNAATGGASAAAEGCHRPREAGDAGKSPCLASGK